MTSRNDIARSELRGRRQHDQALEASHRRKREDLAALEEQKYALDQHAIVAITDVQRSNDGCHNLMLGQMMGVTT